MGDLEVDANFKIEDGEDTRSLSVDDLKQLPDGAATDSAIATVKSAVDAVTAKLIAAPATSAKQDTLATAVAAVQTAVAQLTKPTDTQPVKSSTLDAAEEASYAQLTGIGNSVAVALSTVAGGIPAGAKYVMVIPTGAIRYRADGTAPTAAIGMPVAAGQAFPVDGDLAQVQFIAQSGSGITIDLDFKLA